MNEILDFFQIPVVFWTILILWTGYMIGKWRARREDDLIGPPPSFGKSKSLSQPHRSRRSDGSPQTLPHELAEWAELDPETEAAINDAMAKGQKINAIKILREATGLGLKESKDAIEARLRGQ